MKNITMIVATLLAAVYCGRAAVPGLVPAPVSMREMPGEFVFDSGVGVFCEYHDTELADYLARRLYITAPSEIWSYGRQGKYIRLAVDKHPDLPEEGYRLLVSSDSVVVSGRDRGGLVCGIHTFLQLVPPDILPADAYFDTFTVPCVEITDYPRFPYRGFSFDVARTFTDARGVMRLLEQMAFHKLNRLHWHLTDDEGWRIELDEFPELTSKGAAYRGDTSPVRNIYGEWGRKYGGFYTKEEIREVVSYARLLNIEIIPEFDLPGHSRAIARIYPEILCRGGVDTTAAGYDMRKVWCAVKEENYDLIEKILDEICDLFPQAMIHTGGDEVPPEQWETCPDCRALMEREGIDTKGLNTLLQNRVGEMLRRRGRSQAVWNEAVDGGFLDGSAVVSAWENENAVAEAVKKGYRTIAMPSQFCYFDMKQSAGEYGLAWGGIIDTRRVYEYEPVPMGYGDDAILGVEGAFWTETLLWNGRWWMDYQLFPRLCALAERMWSPATFRDWTEFDGRLSKYHLPRLSALGIGYRGSDGIKYLPSAPGNRIKPAYTVSGSIPCTAKNPYSNASDGSDKTFARTVRTPLGGDWFEYTFDKPVECTSITVKTGYSAIPRFVVGPAVLEVSYDGENYQTVDDNFGYTGTLFPEKAVHKIRLTVKGFGNGEEAAILHDLMIER
ncbi:MAG: family 20 glycosylhydrolase [Rikenellaceae bacterium]|nr:family 20 glycosylhydrolase [Rikenellaceae bacterium]